MAQQHYEGKKHKRNAARARLLEQLAGSLDAAESRGELGLGAEAACQGGRKRGERRIIGYVEQKKK